MIRLVASAMPLTAKIGRTYSLNTVEEQHVGYLALHGKDLPDKLVIEVKGKGIKEAIDDHISS